MFTEYKIFNEIKEEQLSTLLPCINARVLSYPQGRNLLEEGFACEGNYIGLILNGTIHKTASDISNGAGPVELTSDDIIGTGHHSGCSSLICATNTTLLRMDYSKIIEPCWFSCHFHWKFYEALNI